MQLMLGCWATMVLLFASSALVGCDIVGPRAIYSGRPAYNEAIEETNSQQIFDLIVRNRFGESSGLLAVSSVSANFRLSGSIDANFGIGNPANFAGNLVPLSTGAAYEESPTITYTPVEGQDFLAEIFGHLPLDMAVFMVQAFDDPGNTMIMLFKSINSIPNPAYRNDDGTMTDPRFLRIVQLLGDLGRSGHLSFASDGKDTFIYGIRGDNARAEALMRELAGLLSLSFDSSGPKAFRVPFILGIGDPSGMEVRVETRSIAQLLQIASASMQVPQEQIASGLAADMRLLGSVGDLIQIRSSDSRPEDALVATRAHGTWYYISDTDIESKNFFRILERLMSTRIADAARRDTSGPVLTLPVAR